MTQIIAVTGQAGTGKTHWLMQKASELAPTHLTAEHHSLLAITRMHGSRRRLVAKLRESCPSIPCSVTTIDGFALSIVNRWRTALGYTRPIQPVSSDVDFSDTIFGTEAGYEHIVRAATRLLGSATVGAVIRETYPLVMIDEFQDCHGPLLDFVAALSKHSSLLLAADDFQLLDSAVAGCPAVEWARAQAANGAGTIEERTDFHRTSDVGILAAARCLRENTPATGQTVPLVSCPTHSLAAWKIIYHLEFGWYSPRWKGTCAVICPSHDSLLQKVLDSTKSQLVKKNRAPIRWHVESSQKKERDSAAANLGLTSATRDSDRIWQRPSGSLDAFSALILTRSQRYARLRGLDAISNSLVARHMDMAVHDQRAYCFPSSGKTVTTVHGAKNREFDSVFVLWNPFSVGKWNADEQRRLLYNAVTRSKHNCAVLAVGTEDKVRNDPVLALVGEPVPAVPPKTKTGKRRTKKARK